MSILSLASYNSKTRGYDYYKREKVFQSEQVSNTSYCAKVSGSNGEIYDVMIDTTHPRKSS